MESDKVDQLITLALTGPRTIDEYREILNLDAVAIGDLITQAAKRTGKPKGAFLARLSKSRGGPIRATVADYDAKGEARDTPVPEPSVWPQQAPLPGVPAAAELFPRYQGLRVSAVYVGFAGGFEIKDAQIATMLAEWGGRFRIVVEGEVVGHKYDAAAVKSGQPRSLKVVATVHIADAARAEFLPLDERYGRVLAPQTFVAGGPYEVGSNAPVSMACPDPDCAFLTGHEGNHGWPLSPAEERQIIAGSDPGIEGADTAVLVISDVEGNMQVSPLAGPLAAALADYCDYPKCVWSAGHAGNHTVCSCGAGRDCPGQGHDLSCPVRAESEATSS